jgi:hypothetical protein
MGAVRNKLLFSGIPPTVETDNLLLLGIFHESVIKSSRVSRDIVIRIATHIICCCINYTKNKSEQGTSKDGGNAESFCLRWGWA